MNLPPILVLAGGLGTRVAHISGNLPKCLIPIKGRPFIDWQLDLLEKNRLKKIVFSVGHLEEEIRIYLESKNRSNLEIKFVSDGSKPLGTGGAVANSLSELGPEFLVIYGDSYLPTSFTKFYEFASKFEACLTCYKNSNRFDSSNIKFVENSRIFYKKDQIDKDFEYIDYGLLFFRRKIFEEIENKSYDLGKYLEELSLKNRLHGFKVKELFYEIGSAEGIKRLEKKFSKPI